MEVYRKIPPSQYLAALVPLSLWLSPCGKWRRDADLKQRRSDLEVDISCRWSFTQGGEAARWGAHLPPSPFGLRSLPTPAPYLRACRAGSCAFLLGLARGVMHNNIEMHTYTVMRHLIERLCFIINLFFFFGLKICARISASSSSYLSQQMFFFSRIVRTVPRGLHKSNCSWHFIMQKYFCHWVIIVLIVRQFWKQKTQYLHNAISFWLCSLFQLH